MRPSSARWHGRNPRDAAPKAPKPEANAIGTAVRNTPSILFFVHNKGCAKEEAYPVDSGLSRCSMLSDRIGAVARADIDGEGAVARGIPEVVSR